MNAVATLTFDRNGTGSIVLNATVAGAWSVNGAFNRSGDDTPATTSLNSDLGQALIGVPIACPVPSGSSADCVGPGDRPNTTTGRCYRVVGLTKTRADAEANCEAWGGTLIAINDQAEQNYVNSTLLGDAACYIGLASSGSPTGPFSVWQTGEAVTYTNWAASEPSNTTGELCVELEGKVANYGNSNRTGHWNNNVCDQLRCSFCER